MTHSAFTIGITFNKDNFSNIADNAKNDNILATATADTSKKNFKKK